MVGWGDPIAKADIAKRCFLRFRREPAAGLFERLFSPVTQPKRL